MTTIPESEMDDARADYERIVTLRIEAAREIDMILAELQDTVDTFRRLGRALKMAKTMGFGGGGAIIEPRVELFATTRLGSRDVIHALEGRERVAHGRPISRRMVAQTVG